MTNRLTISDDIQLFFRPDGSAWYSSRSGKLPEQIEQILYQWQNENPGDGWDPLRKNFALVNKWTPYAKPGACMIRPQVDTGSTVWPNMTPSQIQTELNKTAAANWLLPSSLAEDALLWPVIG